MIRPTPTSTLFPYTTLFRSRAPREIQPMAASRVFGGEAVHVEQSPPCAEAHGMAVSDDRSEEHTSELQSRRDLVCRLLLEKKKTITVSRMTSPISNRFSSTS